jgi:DNA-binding PadR family transcriptional regulator
VTTDPTIGDLLRIHIDVLAEVAVSPKTASAVIDDLDGVYADPPSRSRVYQVMEDLDTAGLIEESEPGEYHNAVRYELTETGEVRLKEYAAHIGSRVFD